MFHPAPPHPPLWRAALKRARWAGSLPTIEHTCDGVPGPPDAYVQLCGFSAADPVPLTWPAVACNGLQLAVMLDEAFPLPVLGIVHTRQTLTRRRHLHPGEALRATCRTAGHRIVRAGGEFDLVLDVEAHDGVVWSGTSTILSRAIPGSGAPKSDPPPAPTWTTSRQVTLDVPADSGWKYAAISGDYNPIHLARYTSFAFGFARPIAHGWWKLARALAQLGPELPEACRVDARFVGTVTMPGTVTLTIGTTADDPRLRFEIAGREPKIVGTVESQGPSAIGA